MRVWVVVMVWRLEGKAYACDVTSGMMGGYRDDHTELQGETDIHTERSNELGYFDEKYKNLMVQKLNFWTNHCVICCLSI